MISLRSDDVTVTVDAVNGGRLASLEVAGRQLLIGHEPEHGPMHWGSYPMVPWAGRVRHGRFTFDGRAVRPAPRHAAACDPRHRLPTAVARRRGGRRRDVDELRPGLGARRPGVAAGRRRRHVRHCVLGVVAGDRAMPAEIGWHPWFTKPLALSFRPEAMYARDGEGIPTGELVPPPPGPWDDCFVNTEAGRAALRGSDGHGVVGLRSLGRIRRTSARDLRGAPIRPTRRVQPATPACSSPGSSWSGG